MPETIDAPDRVIHIYGKRIITMCGHCGEPTTYAPCRDHQPNTTRGD